MTTFVKEPFPQSLNIEASARCNSRCTMCPYGKLDTRPAYMCIYKYQSILDEARAAGGVDTISLSLYGEPLMNPSIVDMVMRAKQTLPAAKIGFFTNGSLLTETLAQDLIDAGLKWITFSVDAVDREKYERIRRGLSWAQVIGNIMKFLHLNEQMRHPVRTRVHMTVQPETLNDLGEFIRRWSTQEGVDEASYLPCDGRGGADRDPALSRHGTEGPCYSPFGVANILTDGTFVMCCMDYKPTLPLGNVFDNGIASVWNGEALETIRKCHNDGSKADIPLCSACATHF